ncbi:uncharacterized protein C13orf42 [Dunckerocampus dactyliophorus]|uniref:uncharacterized protein C13orf42 n=1 Tax=Dunckerocampus dactyliophorus TaxID=161453 RepID=UPI0024067EF0|nr:uncharacterized protein C13orf42 [Dunckerocampus dactyliophorus]
MFRKIHHVFRPNHNGQKGRDSGSCGGRGGFGQDYHSACTVRLVRSTSMLVLGERSQSTLKRSKSTVSIESTLYYYQRQEDRIWLYSQNRNCLEYLEALVALRRRYTESVLKSRDNARASAPSKKKAAPPAPHTQPASNVTPSAPPVPNVEDTLQFLDDVIASCDGEAQRKPYTDNGHADVDFIVASSSAEHNLHSNWVLRVPRGADDPDSKQQEEVVSCAKEKVLNKKNQSGSTSSRLRLQRNPIHLPKVVESTLQTLRFKAKWKKS